MKFQRRYELKVEVNPDGRGVTQSNVTIPPNITVEFEIVRQFLGSSQTALFRLYNLSEETRNLIQKDPYVINENKWAIQFRAGYEDTALSLCFNGWVRYATSWREGVNFITEIDCYDGGLAIANGFVSTTLAPGTSVKQALQKLAKTLPRMAAEPIIGDFPQVNTRGKVLFGNTWNVIMAESNGLATIDNGQLKILQPNEAIRAGIPVINADTGLLGSPRRTPTSLTFDLLFEPRLTLGQIVQLDSSTNRRYNGTYRVSGFTHAGIISPAVNGDCSTNVLLFFGTEEFKDVAGTIPQ